MSKTLTLKNASLTLNENGEYEGKVLIWGKEVESFIDTNLENERLSSLANEKLDWVIENKAKILACFIEENDHFIEVINEAIDRGEFEASSHINERDILNALFIHSLSFYLFDGEETSIVIDLEAEPDYLFGHLACIEIDHDYTIEFGGLNG